MKSELYDKPVTHGRVFSMDHINDGPLMSHRQLNAQAGAFNFLLPNPDNVTVGAELCWQPEWYYTHGNIGHRGNDHNFSISISQPRRRKSCSGILAGKQQKYLV